MRRADILILPYQIFIEARMFLDRLSDGLLREVLRGVFRRWLGVGRTERIQIILPPQIWRIGMR
ncbi:hypothetical protein LRP30_07130 [Bradyrhizobium sp. C-145]|uniref:hypothetical protein n=1 Tax=Bradyrhizobium sp. C-145 TaxID=574727 RepID=UPI00201B7999|nr:hypothetical protein [Bradyrhizobium sp. C-145]UQR65029.1 hypothetical protein LRP30_07130 [Bradyrhizobium sp. C-145]